MDEHNVLETKNLSQLTRNSCRLCLANEKNLTILDKKVTDDFCQQINEFTNVLITKQDFSTTVCKSCIKTLATFTKFRKKCIEINDFLHLNGYCQHKSSQTPETSSSAFLYVDVGLECELIASGQQEICINEDLDKATTSNQEAVEPSNIESGVLEKSINKEDTTSKVELKCRYKLKTKDRSQLQIYDNSFPKLKKRDLMETKAYRGLCHLCGREFQHLWVHLQSHSESPTETCDICGKGFKSKPNLQLHNLLHKDAELPCDVCGKKYRTKMRLKRHQRVHNGERPFQCSVCTKSFYTKYNLEVHGRSHTGSRPYSCNVCDEKFIHSYALKNHTDKYHKM